MLKLITLLYKFKQEIVSFVLVKVLLTKEVSFSYSKLIFNPYMNFSQIYLGMHSVFHQHLNESIFHP